MTSGIETVTAREWLYSVLTGDATLMSLAVGGVWEPPIPKGTAYPLVMFTLSSPGIDTRGVGYIRVMSDPQFAVRGVHTNKSYGGVLAQIAARIDLLIHGKSGIVTNGQVVACVREQPFEFTHLEDDGITQYRQLGGIYRIYAQ